jgi:hypothetical protein
MVRGPSRPAPQKEIAVKRIGLIAALALSATAAQAVDFQSAMKAYLDGEVRNWAAHPTIVEAVRARNALTVHLTGEQIGALDAAWMSEIASGSGITIDPILHAPVSRFLREKVAASEGRISEILVMDARGLNVGISSITSDFWQGDEDKYLATFASGPNSLHIGDVDFDESSQAYLVQISFPLLDPDTGTSIGAVTIGMNADAF